MPRRSILTARQRATLFDLPTDEASILYHYTLGPYPAHRRIQVAAATRGKVVK